MNRMALARIDYGLPSAPDVLVIASNPENALCDIEAVEARCSATVTLEHAAAPLDGGRGFDLALFEIDPAEADDERVGDVFAWLQRGAELDCFASVVCLPPTLIDFASAALDHPAIRLLVAPDPAERRAALAAALPERGPMRVFDGGADTGTAIDMREEVAKIARRLAILAAPTVQPHAQVAANDVRVDAALVRSIIRARRLREQYFDAELFADPAWDMLLDLSAARLEGSDVAVSSLCIAAAVPPTTALRWIKILTDNGLFVRRADPADKRRIFIALDDHAADAMLSYLAAMQRSGAIVV